MSLAALGADGYRRAIEHQARMADVLRAELCARGWRVVNETPLPLVCFTHPAIETGAVPVADVVKELLARNFWVSEVRLGELEPVLRARITSYRTEPADVAALAAAATEIVAAHEAS
jgi:aromatic-L-amino-acid decarboxylase